MELNAVLGGLIKTGIRGQVIGRGDPSFDDRRRIWNGLFNRRPAAIVRAIDANDVSLTVRFAAEHDLLLAVRGGGHSLPGLSTCDDGVVLDLSLISAIHVDPVARIAVVGGGARLGDMDRATVAHGLVTPAGVVSHTGVGGLTLGGGMGWLSRRLGLTIDNLLGATAVLADGTVVDIDADSDPELFWGIRGGGGNFGIITAFRFRVHELGPVMIGLWAFDPRSAVDVLRRYADLTTSAPRELTTAFTLTSGALNVTAVWSGYAPGSASAIAAYGRIGAPTAASLGEQTFLGVQSKSDEHFPWGRRVYAKGGFLEALDDRVIEVIERSAATSPTLDSEVYVLRLGGAIKDVDARATAYAGRDAEHYWIVEPVWDDPSDDEACLAWGRSIGRSMAGHSMAANYVNEQADSDAAVAQQAYGEATYRRLAALKARVDPANLFRLNQNIQPGR